jgi:hypothetical protein
VPVLIREARDGQQERNPWGISFMAMFHMSNDSHLFQDTNGEGLLPLYEAKMIHQFDHRWATYEVNARGQAGKGEVASRDVSATEKAAPQFSVTPRYWVSTAEVQQRLADKGWAQQWLLGWRDICRNTDMRTLIGAAIPVNAIDGGFPCMLPNGFTELAPALLANINSLVIDFVARQKVSGAHLKYFHIRQLPILAPDSYTNADRAFIVPRVLDLTYTAHDMQPWAKFLGFDGAPFAFNEPHRAQLRAELDAYYARLYALTRDELRYILDPADVMGEDYPSETFRVLKKNEEREFGEYRTQRLVLEAWDKLEQGELA